MRRRRILSETWPISACFAGYMFWWVLGLSAFIWTLVIVPVLVSILSRGRVRIPRAMVLWFCFLACVLLSGFEVKTGTHFLLFAWRWSLYASAAVLFLFVYNLPRSQRLDRRVLHGLTGLWMGVVFGGYLGLLLHGHTFTTPIQHVLPAHLRANSFVQTLVQPVFAETQAFLGFPVPRPAAPFAYTNLWGGTIAALTPIAFAEIALARRGPWKTVVTVVLFASVIPMVISLNRGMFLSLLVGAVYVAVRLAARGQRRSLLTVLSLVAVAFVVVVATPLGHLVAASFSSTHGNSNATRLSVSSQAIAGANQSPWIGHGVPQASTTGPTASTPAIGTQGQLWTVLFTNGYPATVFFVGFVLWVMWETRRARGMAGLWLHTVPLIALSQILVYGWLPTEVQVVLVASALAYRSCLAPSAADVSQRRERERPLVTSLTVPPEWEREPSTLAMLQQRSAGSVSLSGDPRHVARGSIVNIATMTGGYVLTFTLTVLVSRWLGPRSGGVFFELVAMFMILSTTLTLGADTGLTRWISHAKAVGRTADIGRMIGVAVAPVLVLGGAAAAAIWLAAPEVAHLFLRRYSARSVVSDVRFVAVFIPLGALSTAFVAAARGFGRMWPYMVVEGISKPVLRLAFVSAALIGGSGVYGAVIGWSLPVCLGAAAAAAILMWIVRSEALATGHHSAPSSWPRVAREFWRFTSARSIAGAFQVAVTWLDILLVGALLSTFASGVYAAVSRLVMLGTFALEGTRLAISPHLSALMSRKEFPRVGELYQTATRWLVLASWPLYLLCAVFPGVVLGVFGPRYHVGAGALVILAVAMLVNVGTGNVTVVLLMGGRSSWNVANTVGALAVNIGLNLYLLPRIGIEGAAVAWAASIILDNVAAMVEVWFLYRLSPFGRSYWLTGSLACGVFLAVGEAAKTVIGPTRGALVAAAFIGTLIYGLCIFWLRERLQLSGLIGEIRARGIGSASAAAPAFAQASPAPSVEESTASLSAVPARREP